MSANNALPFEILQEIVSALGVDQNPIKIGKALFRPLVFQVNATNAYVFALVPADMEPGGVFDELNKQYDLYLDGEETEIRFFRANDPNELKTLVIDWYTHDKH